MRTLFLPLALLLLVDAGPVRAQDSPEPERLPPLAQAVLDSAIAIELANLPGVPLTLADAQAIAMQGNTRVRIAKAEVAVARGAVRTEQGEYDPELFGEGGVSQ